MLGLRLVQNVDQLTKLRRSKVPRTFSKKISQEELWEKIHDAKDSATHYGYQTLKGLTEQVRKDLSKVEFDTENIDVDCCETLSNGLSFVGVSAGGDWEWPVFFIIYYDGKKLRGYIPKDGNLWNTNSKRAYGNDDYDDNDGTPGDIANAKKRGFIAPDDDSGNIEYTNMKRDMKKIIADIEFRIQYVGK
jgi:hypothetical protein